MYFKALAFIFASAALAQSDPRTVQVSFDVEGQNPIFGALENDCSFFPFRNSPVSDIEITPLTLENPTCVFYTERECEGQQYALKEGPHHFTRDFFVGSFICSASE